MALNKVAILLKGIRRLFKGFFGARRCSGTKRLKIGNGLKDLVHEGACTSCH